MSSKIEQEPTPSNGDVVNIFYLNKNSKDELFKAYNIILKRRKRMSQQM
jgi:hypothetical protein